MNELAFNANELFAALGLGFILGVVILLPTCNDDEDDNGW